MNETRRKNNKLLIFFLNIVNHFSGASCSVGITPRSLSGNHQWNSFPDPAPGTIQTPGIGIGYFSELNELKGTVEEK